MTAEEKAALRAKVRGVSPEAREKVRATLLEFKREGRPVKNRAVRDAAGVDTNAVSYTLAAWRADLLDLGVSWLNLDAPAPVPSVATPAAGGVPDPTLETLLAAVDAATSPAATSEVSRLVARLVVLGQLDGTAARIVLDAVTETRRGVMDEAKVPADRDLEGEVLVARDTAELVSVVEGIVSGARRRELLEQARRLAADDARDFPTDCTPEQVRATLERLGLDAHGEPVVA